jgi:DNA gyrase subunit A
VTDTTTTAPPDEPRPDIEPVEIQEEMERSFLEYAMSVITMRALPDARDGLKPVHRRILYSMYDSGFRPDRPHVKCARVVGDVIANYHPHSGDAVYDALVRLAQPFSLRHPLIDFHGNYGSPDFPPAAMRYTECRLDQLTMNLLDGIDEDTVDFGDNFSGDRTEPAVLPSRFPNLLVAGGQGIAVGMASNIPPHNLGEVIDATVHLIDNPDATSDELMQFVKGPDFPTGAFILGRAGILDAYRTGRGSIRMRARAEIVEDKRGNVQIVVSELPYQVSVGAVAEKVKEVVDNRTLDGIRELRDLSSGEETRLVFDLKRDANANVVLNNLYKYTPLQTSFGVNMVALVDGVPRTLNLRSALVAYADHQIEVVTRRTKFRLKKAEDRAHILEGLIRALDVIDAIIATIRASEDRGAAREALMAETFGFTEVQANHILDMQLVSLTRLNGAKLREELEEKRAEIAELQSILASDVKLRGVIKSELAEIRDKFATGRKAEITFDPGDMSIEDFIDDVPVVVVMTKAGYIKTVAASAFRTQGRGGRGVAGANLKEEDLVTRIIHTTMHAYLLFFSNLGKVYRLKAHEVPMKERTARGTAIVNLLPLAPEERIQAVIDTRDYPDDRYLFFATRTGQVKKTAFSEYDKSRREGFIAINLNEGDELVRVIQTSGDDDIFMVSRLGMTIRFNETDVRPMGRVAAGVRGMRMKDGDEVVSCDVARDDTSILIVTDAGYGKRTQLDRFNRQARGGQGVRGIRLTARKGHVIAAFMVGLDDDIFLVSSGGVTMRIPVRGISSQGRDATGVRVMNLDEGQSVASAAPILSPEDEEDAAAGVDPSPPSSSPSA